MGKHLPKREASLSLSVEKNHPGCMWSLVHVLHHQRWFHVKKMIPNRRHNSRRTQAGHPGAVAATGNYEFKQHIDPQMKKTLVLNPATKSSVRKLKSIFLIEMSKRKGNHRRTSSCPDKSQLKRTESINLLENSVIPRIESPQAVNIKNSSLVPQGESKLQDDSTETQSKQLLDALDIFNMNKELFGKLLRDPISPLSYHIHKQQTSKPRSGYAKSLSFPSRFGEKTELLSEKHEAKEDLETYATMKYHKPEFHNNPPKSESTEDELSDHDYCPCSPRGRTRKGNVKVIKHFKNLRRKIKHAIHESKKERQRVTMDAVLHKIPYGKKCPNDVPEKVSEIWTNPNEEEEIDKPGRGSISFRSVSMVQSGRKATSFDPPIDKYNWLYESSCRKEIRSEQVAKEVEKNEKMEKPSSGGGNIKKSFERIISLPDLRSYYYLFNEPSPDAPTPLDRPSRKNSNDDPIKAVVKLEKISKGVQDHAENQTENDKESHQLQDEELENDLGVSAFKLQNESEPTPVSLLESPQDDVANPSSSSTSVYLPEVELVKENLQLDPESFFFFQKEDFAESNNQEKAVLHSPGQCEDKLSSNMLVSKNDIVEFNYVKNVLERSGLSGKNHLSTWQPADKPVGRSVYEEMEDGLVLGSNIPKTEIDNWDRLLLFDLINEVLMQIHDRAFTYCPINLTWVSQIRPLPTGGHVLEEVWNGINWYLSWKPEADQSMDEAVTRDMGKYDGWMNIQLDAECVSLELEDMIFDELLEELEYDLEWD
ncbi:protein TRM32-like [Impatiens glandulifera]|uniref:protein TRM32-like n=1 Tax=Impatiens glandulifera TaxID=253017 RepID=UPI001FB0C43C|nr:protein TRM32-like [Impatiens glandulifera]